MGGELLDRGAHGSVGRQHRVGVDQQHAELGQLAVTRRRQRELIALAGLERIGPGDHVEQERKIGGRARHRPDHREIAVERQRRQGRRRMAA